VYDFEKACSPVLYRLETIEIKNFIEGMSMENAVLSGRDKRNRFADSAKI